MVRTVDVEVEPYDPARGVRLVWDVGFEIEASCENGEVMVRANRQGLVSLARHLLTLADDGVPRGSHIHLTGGQELEEPSLDLVVGRL